MTDRPPDPVPHQGGFATTRWSLVARAGDAGREGSRAALAELCESYWGPVFAYVRRRVPDEHEARDRTQALFADLLERESFAGADPERGRFRSFLLGAARNFLARVRRDERALKRGGGRAPVSLEELGADPADEAAEREFEREWALSLLERVIAGLRAESEAAGRGALFEVLAPRLLGTAGEDAASTEAEARALGLHPTSLRVAAHRLRQSFGKRLRAEIRDTVANDEAVEDELRELFQALAR